MAARLCRIRGCADRNALQRKAIVEADRTRCEANFPSVQLATPSPAHQPCAPLPRPPALPLLSFGLECDALAPRSVPCHPRYNLGRRWADHIGLRPPPLSRVTHGAAFGGVGR
jgi:hypothetical protein